MFTIGIDPHKGSHLAAVFDQHEQFVDELRVRADRTQRDRLLQFAAPYAPRVWAIEGARGLGALVAQQLVAAGETVFDVPAKLSARVRVLDNECADKNDTHDARAAAIVGICNRRLVAVTPEHHAAVLRLLAKRHHDLVGRRTQSICRLHALLATMTAGGLPRLLSADRAAHALRRLRPTDAVGIARRHAAVELLGEVRVVDRQLVELRARIGAAVRGADTTVTDVYGVGPIVAALSDRLHRRHHPVRDQRSLRPLQRDRTLSRVVGTEAPASAQRSRQPATQPCAAPRGRHADLARHRRAATTTDASKPNDTATKKHSARSSGASATPSTTGCKPTPNAEPTRAREGSQGRLLNPAWPANP